jgi:NAD(P)-dependent dehydrogenase (short-subunit alcohol dehydrogenase family)
MRVVIGYRTTEHLEEAMKYLEGPNDRIRGICVDVIDRPGMERAAEETVKTFGKVHVLVNNAGVQNPAILGNTSYAEWDRLIGVNLTGVFNGIRAFVPHIKAHGEGGQVIATSSIVGLFVGGAGYGAYCSSKFAVMGLMESLRAELADTNIGVSVFCPGVVKSNLEANLKDFPAASDPLEIGQLVLQGMYNNDLYILTHPEFEPVMQLRHEALIASLPKDLCPSEARVAVAHAMLRNSIYATERTGASNAAHAKDIP